MAKKTKITLEKVNVTVVDLKVTVEKIATLMVEGFETMNGKVDALSSDMRDVKRDTADIKDDLEAHGKAIDKDAKTIINHETRIKKLEHSH